MPKLKGTGYFLFIALLFCVQQASAEPCLKPQARNPEGNYVTPGVRGDIVYRRIGNTELSLDAYIQRQGERRPAVVVLHGGGQVGSRAAFLGQFLELLTREGYNWFAIDYRPPDVDDSSSAYKNAVEDLRASIEFLRCNARAFRIDPSNIALLGEDTGAHIGLEAMVEGLDGVKSMVAIGGRFNLEKLAIAAAAEGSSGINVLAVHGSADREQPPATLTRLRELFAARGASFDLFLVEGGIHRAENWRPSQWLYKQAVAAWLGSKTSLKSAEHVPYQTRLQKEILYRREHGLKLDAYTPPGRGPFPAVIVVHGGGWEAGDKVTYVTPILSTLAQAGFAWFSIDYRLTPEAKNSDQIDDLRAAIQFISRNSKRFNIDPAKIAVLGESASGQMAALLATESPKELAAVVSFYGVYDFEAMAGDLSPRSIPARLFNVTQLDHEARELLRRYSPLHAAKKNMTPIYLICGTKDSLAAQHNALVQKLDQLGARYEAMMIDGAPHGMENWEGRSDWAYYKTRMIDWLRSTLQTR